MKMETPTKQMVIDVLAEKVKSLEYQLLQVESKVMFQEEELAKLKQENVNLKYELKEVA